METNNLKLNSILIDNDSLYSLLINFNNKYRTLKIGRNKNNNTLYVDCFAVSFEEIIHFKEEYLRLEKLIMNNGK